MAVPSSSSHEASIHPPPPSPSKWGPYSSAGEFSVNMIVALIILFCALFLGLAISAIVRYLLCANRRRSHHEPSSDPEKPPLGKAAAPDADSAPAQIFAAGAKAAGAEECAICLLEFADGDRVRVLPACEHWFHAGCIERWLTAKSSCPTCRTSFHVAAAGPAVAAA